MGKPTNGARKGSRKSAKKERIRGTVNNYVARRLRELRLTQGKTCEEVAQRIGISTGSYSGLENGWYRISLDHLYAVLKALDAPIVEVWPLSTSKASGRSRANGRRAGRPRSRHAATVEEVLEAVAEAFDVAADTLASKSRWSRLQEARGVCGMLGRELSGLSFRALAGRLALSESALGNLVRRHSRQAQQDEVLADRIASARALLERRHG